MPNGLNQLLDAAITVSLCTDQCHNTAKRNDLSFGSSEFRKWINMNLEISVSIVIRLWAECLRNGSSILGGGYIFVSSPKPCDRLCDLPSLLFREYWWLCPGGNVAWA